MNRLVCTFVMQRYFHGVGRIDGVVKLTTNVSNRLRVSSSADGSVYYGYDDCVWIS